MATVAVFLPDETLAVDLVLELWGLDGVAINAVADALAESPANSGRFVATVAEPWTTVVEARIYNGSGGLVGEGWVGVGGSLVVDSYAGAAGGVSAAAVADAVLDEIVSGHSTAGSVGAVLAKIDNQTSLITARRVDQISHVSAGGQITLVRGDDMAADAGSVIEIEIGDAGGALFARLQAADSVSWGASRGQRPCDLISGTVTGQAYASNVCTVSVEIPGTGENAAAEVADDYEWQLQRTIDGLNVIEAAGGLVLCRRRVERVS